MSLCIGVCNFDETKPFCDGCGRTAEEIHEWTTMPTERRREVIKRIKSEVPRLSLGPTLILPDKDRRENPKSPHTHEDRMRRYDKG